MKLYNTMTGKKEELIPLVKGKVGIYSCGPTVYNYFHIGNARPFVVFDTLRRYLVHRGYEVTLVQNFTDIDDKMINKANEEGISVGELADRFIAEYYTDADALQVQRPDVAPRATQHMGDIIALIKRLMEKGLAYQAGGDVYFETRKFKGYAKLSGQDLDELALGVRVDLSESKRDPLDFALWKAEKPEEPSWDSPWGKGRPGWHIECSAMSMKYLGESFDIHGGGQDLIFPHHENEIAQSEGATGKPFVKYWLHNGYINIDNKKMSKSLGNFFTVRDIGAEFDLMAVRLFILSAHYRSPLNFSREQIRQAESALSRMQNTHDLLVRRAEERGVPSLGEESLLSRLTEYHERFDAAMDDDLNTADALGVLFDLVKEANIAFAQGGSPQAADMADHVLLALLSILGITLKEEEHVPKRVTELAEKRQEARTNKDFALADTLRNQVAEWGYLIEDTPNGPVVKKA